MASAKPNKTAAGLLRNVSLKRKLTVIIMLTSGVALLLACVAFVYYERNVFRDSMVRDLTFKADVIGSQSTAALKFNDPKAALEILNKLPTEKHIVAGCIYTRNGKVFAKYQRRDISGEFTPPEHQYAGHVFTPDHLELFRQIVFNNIYVGTIYLKSDLLELKARMKQYASIASAVLLVSMAVAWLLSYRLQQVVSQPILDLAETTRAVSADKNYSRRAPKQSNDELGELIDGFNEMLGQIQARDVELEEGRQSLERRVQERTRALRQEIVERKQAEERLKATATRLEQSNRELQDFAYVASHDLQEPLRKVQAFGDRLKAASAKTLGAEGRDYLERMHAAAKRMQILIDDLLAFSRVTTKANPFEPVDLAKVAREVLSDLEVRVQQTGGEVEVGELPVIDADPLQMRQLFQNLIGNALKFHKEGKPPVVKTYSQIVKPSAAEIDSGGSPQEVCQIYVQDNGIGFDEKYLSRIFILFQRLHGRSAYEGTGIGLAICRKIVDRHGGSITARSAPGQGSTFIVTLPVQQKEPLTA
jgi:signal transduction histidine kinase